MKKSLILLLMTFLVLAFFSTATLTQAAAGPGPTSITFSNPITYDSFEGVLGALLNSLQGIIVTIAMIFMLVGAVMYMTSSGNEKRIETAKKALTAAVVGLALGIAAPSFFKEIYIVLGWSPAAGPSFGSSLSLSEVVRNVLDFLLSIVGVLAFIMLVIGGITYLTSAGDEKKIEMGKNILKYSIIGIAIAWGALVIVNWVACFFTATC